MAGHQVNTAIDIARSPKIETWAKQQKDRPSRSEAIRRLIEIALTAKSKRQSNRGEN